MRIAGISDEEMSKYAPIESRDLLTDKDWKQLDMNAVDNVVHDIGHISEKNLQKVKIKHPQVYVNAAKVWHRFKDRNENSSNLSSDLALGKEIVAANSQKIRMIKRDLDATFNNLTIDQKLKLAVEIAKREFGDYFNGFKENLSDIDKKSYGIQIIQELVDLPSNYIEGELNPKAKARSTHFTYFKFMEGKSTFTADEFRLMQTHFALISNLGAEDKIGAFKLMVWGDNIPVEVQRDNKFFVEMNIDGQSGTSKATFDLNTMFQ